MAIKQIETDRDLAISSNLRLYPVLLDTKDREEFLNVFRSYVVDSGVYENESLFNYYTVEEEDFLDNISNIYYKTPFLWWVVALFNNIVNPYEELEEGKVIRVLKYSYLYIIFDDISTIESL